MNSITLLPPPFLSVSTASSSTDNMDDEFTNINQEQQNQKKKKKKTMKKKKQKKIEDLGDQVVPKAEQGSESPVVEKNNLDEYYRCRLDAPIFRYSEINSIAEDYEVITID